MMKSQQDRIEIAFGRWESSTANSIFTTLQAIK
jgi:hypothetical protein